MKSSLPSLTIILVATTLAVHSPAAAETPDLQRARQLYEQKHFAEALALARQLVAADPQGGGEARQLVCKVRSELPEPPLGDESAILRPNSKPPADPDSVSRPQILFHAPPQYTKEARKSGLQGMVVLTSVVDEEGCVVNVKVLKGLDPGLDAAAVTALRQWTFLPAQHQGKPVKVYYTFTTNFTIEKDPGKS